MILDSKEKARIFAIVQGDPRGKFWDGETLKKTWDKLEKFVQEEAIDTEELARWLLAFWGTW